MEIHKAGGGIMFTVDHTRKSDEKELLDLLVERLDMMAKMGTTLVECKSGYGLDLETEVKMMRVLKKANEAHALDLVVNYCGAHAIPKGSNELEATNDIVNNHIPKIKELMDKNEINPEMIDVFCDAGIFEKETTKKILKAGLDIGLQANFHGDEIKWVDAGTIPNDMKILAISHLENLDEKGIESMSKHKVNGVLLPTTHYLLHLKNPPTREMINAGVIVSLGSDFNPNAYCVSMPFVMNLACINYRMKPNEALVAATLNGAQSMQRSKTHGSIEVGKVADFVIINAKRWENIIY